MATTQTGTTGTTTGTRGTQSMMRAMPDTTYNLISVMYHTLQGCQTYEQYAQDAEQAGQQEIAQFFRDTGREFERCAERGQKLLAQCLQQGQAGQGGRSGQLHSQMGASSEQQGQSGGVSSGQQGQMSGKRGQQDGSQDRSGGLGRNTMGSTGSSRR